METLQRKSLDVLLSPSRFAHFPNCAFKSYDYFHFRFLSSRPLLIQLIVDWMSCSSHFLRSSSMIISSEIRRDLHWRFSLRFQLIKFSSSPSSYSLNSLQKARNSKVILSPEPPAIMSSNVLSVDLSGLYRSFRFWNCRSWSIIIDYNQ